VRDEESPTSHGWSVTGMREGAGSSSSKGTHGSPGVKVVPSATG
jgi:hypothetical protein